ENGKEEKSKLLKEIDRLKLEISDLRRTTRHEEEEIEEFHTNRNKSFQTLTRHLENRNEKITKLQKEITSLEQEYSELQATTKCQAEESRKCQKKQNKLIQELKMRLENGKEENSEQLIDRLKLEIAELQAKTKHQEEKIKELESTHSTLLELCTTHVEEQTEEKNKLQKAIHRLNLENSDLRAARKYQG
ncbi:GRIP and coiled-coil domain-containing protein 2-like, partial [Mesocricetus auratus]|uniref:GRIP and coiled-coil domain-containing protein 2-like n=1 Tax=Mesocricetus auratus TaxID=10036 RepID=A0ABM2X2E2_MESAU